MYRLMLYGLLIEVVFALLFSFIGWLSYSPLHLIGALSILLFVSYGSNFLFGTLMRSAVNAESSAITGLLLFFVFDPTMLTTHDAWMLALGALVAQASKYGFAIGRKHLFNPVAITAVVLEIFGISLATWWIATPLFFPLVLIFGIMVVRKIRRFEEVGVFMLGVLIMAVFKGVSLLSLLISWPLLYFASMMLIEPRTAPAMKREQLMYGFGIGLLFVSSFKFWNLSMTPELALVIGNGFAYFVNSKQVVRLVYQSMTQEAEQVYDFVFTPDQSIKFIAGQYAEWTLPLQKTDDRGNRRYFTIASAPSESEIHLGVKIDKEKGSAFKKQLFAMKPGDHLFISHVAGDFVLPKDTTKKIVWVAGGIGVTPFRSMAHEMAAQHEVRDIQMLYCVNTEKDFAYQADFDVLAPLIGLKNTCVVAKASPHWNGETGYVSKELMERTIPDYKERIFYFSGPPIMVENSVKLLKSMGVPKKQIKTDYFPGF